VEGKQPSRTCDKCQPEHKSRLADRTEPQLIRDPSEPSVPSSIPEGLTLRVEVQYTVTEDGDVTDVRIIKSSGYKALDHRVTQSVSGRKYKPAVQDGVARRVKVIQPYKFKT
jgi:TonB family protein